METTEKKKIPQIITSINRTKVETNLPLKSMYIFINSRNIFIKKLDFIDAKNNRAGTARFLKRKNKI
jgi:hypothetical protein